MHPSHHEVCVFCIERYTFLDRASANAAFDFLAILTDWLPAWLKDAVPREPLAAVVLLVFLMCIAALAVCCMRVIKRYHRSTIAFMSHRP